MIDPHEKALAAAHEKALKNLGKKATLEHIKAAEKAEKALRDYRARKAAEADPGERRFANPTEVHEYLESEGWKVSQRKVYDDKNKIEKEPDGTYTKKAVDEYARLLLTRTDGSDEAIGDLAARKATLEVELLEEKKAEAVRENKLKEGFYVLKSDLESMLAGRAAVLKASVGTEFIHARAEKVIEIVAGDHGRAPELIDYWLREVEDFFDRYSRPMEFATPAMGNKIKEED